MRIRSWLVSRQALEARAVAAERQRDEARAAREQMLQTVARLQAAVARAITFSGDRSQLIYDGVLYERVRGNDHAPSSDEPEGDDDEPTGADWLEDPAATVKSVVSRILSQGCRARLADLHDLEHVADTLEHGPAPVGDADDIWEEVERIAGRASVGQHLTGDEVSYLMSLRSRLSRPALVGDAEPVAWMVTEGSGFEKWATLSHGAYAGVDGYTTEPLYRHPVSPPADPVAWPTVEEIATTIYDAQNFDGPELSSLGIEGREFREQAETVLGLFPRRPVSPQDAGDVDHPTLVELRQSLGAETEAQGLCDDEGDGLWADHPVIDALCDAAGLNGPALPAVIDAVLPAEGERRDALIEAIRQGMTTSGGADSIEAGYDALRSAAAPSTPEPEPEKPKTTTVKVEWAPQCRLVVHALRESPTGLVPGPSTSGQGLTFGT